MLAAIGRLVLVTAVVVITAEVTWWATGKGLYALDRKLN